MSATRKFIESNNVLVMLSTQLSEINQKIHLPSTLGSAE